VIYRTNCAGCDGRFEAKRPHARYCSDTCRARAWKDEGDSPSERGAERVPGHPLQQVRDDQAQKKHNRDLGGLIKQAIVDQIKTTSECFPDDLTDLYPEGEVKECRRLATAQFDSLVSAGLIFEKERRKSTFGSRKGAKAGVYVFTEKGRAELAGRSTADVENRSAASGDSPSSAGVSSSQEAGWVSHRSSASTGAPDLEPLSLLPEPPKAGMVDLDQRSAA
jgi:hypothetical protein